MTQHPRITVDWAVACLEHALENLGDSHAEARVRKQFHQLVLALERDGYSFFDKRTFLGRSTPARIIVMPDRTEGRLS
jgi:hypothetical protein